MLAGGQALVAGLELRVELERRAGDVRRWGRSLVERKELRVDLGGEREVAALFDHVEERYGGVDVVVHAAGSRPRAVCAAAARSSTSPSTVVRLALPAYTAYAATKGAVDAPTLILAKELRGRDITVNAVAPGPTATPLFLDAKDQETIDRVASMPPLERLGAPEDIAETVAFLAGPARWVNGQVVYTNGGVA